MDVKNWTQVDCFIGEMRLFPYKGSGAPNGWMECKGQILLIKKYYSLYSLIGKTYGGYGRDTFQLPDLRGRTAVARG
jgi:microcystin-dependent protein